MRSGPLSFVLAGMLLIAAALMLSAQHNASSLPAAIANPQATGSAVPMILQEADGDQLVHRAGPLRGVPFTIKIDGQFGNSEDFFAFAEALKPGETIPFHKHENAEELLIFQERGAMVTVGTKRGIAGAQSMVFIPRDTWISATNTGDKELHALAIFSRHGFEKYMRAIGVRPGEPLTPFSQDELTRLRSSGHAVYWDTSKGAYPPGVAHP